jgi:2-amino-4-hydroxy-6-hydroxymethyldihydropteridine diphosphokinase
MRGAMSRAWIGVGSNLGDRLGYIKKALGMIERIPETSLVVVSSIYDTAPVGKEDQPRFLNAVAEVATELAPRALMGELLAIEDHCGRIRRDMWGPRTLDLDLLIYGDVEILSEELTVPHRRLADRAFVLVPLAEIAPEVVVPGTGKDVATLESELGDRVGEVSRIGGPPSPSRDA